MDSFIYFTTFLLMSTWNWKPCVGTFDLMKCYCENFRIISSTVNGGTKIHFNCHILIVYLGRSLVVHILFIWFRSTIIYSLKTQGEVVFYCLENRLWQNKMASNSCFPFHWWLCNESPHCFW